MQRKFITSSVAAWFGRHGMPPPVCKPGLWPFDLETGVRVASEVGNLHSKFGHAMGLRTGSLPKVNHCQRVTPCSCLPRLVDVR